MCATGSGTCSFIFRFHYANEGGPLSLLKEAEQECSLINMQMYAWGGDWVGGGWLTETLRRPGQWLGLVFFTAASCRRLFLSSRHGLSYISLSRFCLRRCCLCKRRRLARLGHNLHKLRRWGQGQTDARGTQGAGKQNTVLVPVRAFVRDANKDNRRERNAKMRGKWLIFFGTYWVRKKKKAYVCKEGRRLVSACKCVRINSIA